MRVRAADVDGLPDGTQLWYAYTPGPSARTHVWSTPRDTFGDVTHYTLSDDTNFPEPTIGRSALRLAANQPGTSAFYTTRYGAPAALGGFTPRLAPANAPEMPHASTRNDAEPLRLF
jgi:hypothetical protein